MIWAFSRDEAEAENPSTVDHVIISITDPDTSFAELAMTERTLSVLRLRFDDWHLLPRGG